MDSKLRRAPNAEWVLMYRHGLGRKRIAALVGAKPATVGYHLVIARRQDPETEVAHLAAASKSSRLSPSSIARMNDVIAWITTEGRFPRERSEDKKERSIARWISDRRRESAEGTLQPAYREGLARVPGWDLNPRARADEARWRVRLAQLADFRAHGYDWPRHRGYASELEHSLGVWIHAQRQKRRMGKLDPVKIQLLNETAPGWESGRTRGRPARR